MRKSALGVDCWPDPRDAGRHAGAGEGGVEAYGYYHQPLLTPSVWPPGWELLELNRLMSASSARCKAAAGSRPMLSTWTRTPRCCWRGRDFRSGPGFGCGRGDGVDSASPGDGADGDEDPAVGPAGPGVSGLTLALPDVLGAMVGGWSPMSSPTRPGWPPPGRRGSCGSPPPADYRSAGRSRTGWSPRPATPCPRPMRWWPPGAGHRHDAALRARARKSAPPNGS